MDFILNQVQIKEDKLANHVAQENIAQVIKLNQIVQ